MTLPKFVTPMNANHIYFCSKFGVTKYDSNLFTVDVLELLKKPKTIIILKQNSLKVTIAGTLAVLFDYNSISFS